MRRLLLASAAMVFCASAQAQTIAPGSGSITDATGNVWSIDQYGNVVDGTSAVPGGGNTAALTIAADGTVYGRDDGHGLVNPGGWFALDGAGTNWTPAAAPPIATLGNSLQTGGVTPAPSATQTAAGTAQPAAAAVTTCATTPGGAATGSFTTAKGQTIGPTGQPFVARGINIQTGADLPSAAQLQADFPGINFVRFAVYDYNAASPAAISAYINDLTSHGIVVELEDHTSSTGSNIGGGSGTAYTGAQLAAENAWYSSVAAAFKSNPFVWFGTDNEPPSAGLSAWQQQTYNAIRSAGNNSPIMLEKWGGGVPGQMNAGLDPSVYASMTNTIWDMHFYGWALDMSSVTSAAADAQQITGGNGVMPVIIGEYGVTTTATGVDPNGQQVVAAVQGSGYGSAAWVWDYGAANSLSDGNGNLTPFGQQVAGFTALTQNAPASIWACFGATAQPVAGAQAEGIVPQNSLAAIPPPSFGSTN